MIVFRFSHFSLLTSTAASVWCLTYFLLQVWQIYDRELCSLSEVTSCCWHDRCCHSFILQLWHWLKATLRLSGYFWGHRLVWIWAIFFQQLWGGTLWSKGIIPPWVWLAGSSRPWAALDDGQTQGSSIRIKKGWGHIEEARAAAGQFSPKEDVFQPKY